MSSEFGQLTSYENAPMVRFERVIDAAIDAVWAMLSTEDGLERWLAPASVELRVGGAMNIDFGEGEVVGGEIIDLIPGALLEYHWRFTGEPDSIIRFELEPRENGQTTLKLEHRLLPPDQAVGYGAGWHAHIDALAHQLSPSPAGFDWDARFGELLPVYQSVSAS